MYVLYNMQAGIAAPQLLSSLSSFMYRPYLSLVEQLSDSSLYSGVGIVYRSDFRHRTMLITDILERTLLVLNFKHIVLSQDYNMDPFQRNVDLKTSLSIIAQCKAYSEPQAAAGSQPFVIAVFVRGGMSHSPGYLDTGHGPVDIVDDIIKPFLPKSAPHLAHIPKLFFINSWVDHKDLDTQPPSFPDDDDGNYCIAYHLAQSGRADQEIWMDTIANGLLSGKTVQYVIESSQLLLHKNNERLCYFSSLKDKLVLMK